VGVRAHERVEARDGLLVRGKRVRSHDLAEALHVQLVADALPGRHDAHVVEGVRGPLEEREALAVALGLLALVLEGGVLGPRHVRDDGVVNHEGARNARAHLGRVAAALDHRVAHGREVHEDGHAREVLKQHARRHELDLAALLAGKARLHHAARELDGLLVRGGAAHAVLKQHHECPGQPLCARHAGHVVHRVAGACRLERLGVPGCPDGGLELFTHCHQAPPTSL
jgi:hypothetical protein